MARALILAHYDADGIVADYVVDALRRYRPSFDRLVLVSAAATRLPAAAEPLVDTFLPRGNVGYDFCSWRAGIDALGSLSCYDELICANDSVYGPLRDIGPVLTAPRVADADLWGMCVSEQGTIQRGRRVSCPHIQSWFFAMRRPVLQSDAFRRFWDGIVPLDAKNDIVDRYEIGLSEHFLKAGFRIAGIYDAREHGPARLGEIWPQLSWCRPRRSWRLLKKSRRPLHNPSELFPLRLLEAGVPFVKTGIFRVNHYGLDLDHVLRVIRERSAYDIGLIESHVDRVGWAGTSRGPHG